MQYSVSGKYGLRNSCTLQYWPCKIMDPKIPALKLLAFNNSCTRTMVCFLICAFRHNGMPTGIPESLQKENVGNPYVFAFLGLWAVGKIKSYIMVSRKTYGKIYGGGCLGHIHATPGLKTSAPRNDGLKKPCTRKLLCFLISASPFISVI